MFLGGAGGKGVWGKPGQELFEDSTVKDAHDPNYDSDNQVSIVFNIHRCFEGLGNYLREEGRG